MWKFILKWVAKTLGEAAAQKLLEKVSGADKQPHDS